MIYVCLTPINVPILKYIRKIQTAVFCRCIKECFMRILLAEEERYELVKISGKGKKYR